MKKFLIINFPFSAIILIVLFFSCSDRINDPSKETISAINLKRGEIISCGPPGNQFGSVDFNIPGNESVQSSFNMGVKLLHSFEYDEAEKAFAEVIDQAPGTAMAYWGVAMANFHPLWAPPTPAELKKGAEAVKIAQSIPAATKRELAYINSIGSFYKDWDKVDHRTRCLSFERSMEELYKADVKDKEAATFYSLALMAAADPKDQGYTKQKKAGNILTALYPNEPNHPGIVHYIIHTYDAPELAELGLPAARKYASVAPSSAHALHMPSHIFTRLGLWAECIQSNLASVDAAKCYAESAGIKGHWDEELHGLDYLVYAYLQKGDNALAQKQWDYLNTIKVVVPENFKVAYAFAAIPSRYLLENRNWKAAANLSLKENFPWDNFQWQKAIVHFTRLMGSVNTGNLAAAKAEFKTLQDINAGLHKQKDTYKAGQVEIQMKSGEAWIKFREGKNNEALVLMKQAAELEDNTEKHPVTPAEVLPARELLADMLLQMNKPAEALIAYEADLAKHRNRFNGLYGAGLSAEKLGNRGKARSYYQQLVAIAANSSRAELVYAKAMVNGQ